MSGTGVSAVTEIDQVLLACSPHSPGDGIRGAQPLSWLVQFHRGGELYEQDGTSPETV